MSDLDDYSKTLPKLETVDAEAILGGLEPGSGSAKLKLGESTGRKKNIPNHLIQIITNFKAFKPVYLIWTDVKNDALWWSKNEALYCRNNRRSICSHLRQNILRNLVVPFLVGGTTVASVKFAASHMHNPGLAAIFGGIPIGLLSLYFVADREIYSYAINYFYVTMILGIVVLTFYILHSYTSWGKNAVLAIVVIVWIVLVAGRYSIKRGKSSSPASPGSSQQST